MRSSGGRNYGGSPRSRISRIGVCADDPSQVRALDRAAVETGVALPVYVEVNMGGNRCGVEPALALARQIADAPHLACGGLQAYHGSAQHLRGWEERRQAITGAADKAGRTRDLLARHGIECPVVTGAGTGTFEFETASGAYTELQCGSYIFMDAITAATSTATAPRPRPSSRAFSYGRR